MAGAASQAGDADSSRAPGLTSGLQGSVNVHRGALLLVPQWQVISYFVFYIKSSSIVNIYVYLNVVIGLTVTISNKTYVCETQMPRRQQNQNMTNISKSYILTPPIPGVWNICEVWGTHR